MNDTFVTLETFTYQDCCKKENDKTVQKQRDTKAPVREGRWGSERRCARGECPCPQHLLCPLNPSPAVAWGFQKNPTLCPHLLSSVAQLHMGDKHPLPQPQGASYKNLFELPKFKTKAPEQRKGRVGIAWDISLAAWPCRGAAQAAGEFP